MINRFANESNETKIHPKPRDGQWIDMNVIGETFCLKLWSDTSDSHHKSLFISW